MNRPNKPSETASMSNDNSPFSITLFSCLFYKEPLKNKMLQTIRDVVICNYFSYLTHKLDKLLVGII